MWKAPESTVTYSEVGCRGAGSLYSAGNFNRTTYRQVLKGSPETTAIWAPAGKTLGAGPHLTSLALIGIRMSWANPIPPVTRNGTRINISLRIATSSIRKALRLAGLDATVCQFILPLKRCFPEISGP